mmetsp:Transcript_81020/g.262499  ORF Transcript_81020/g.262499 Transcript_81020/m.262499 type:complete len:252 (-) Transcript_81020:1334-2089(-)
MRGRGRRSWSTTRSSRPSPRGSATASARTSRTSSRGPSPLGALPSSASTRRTAGSKWASATFPRRSRACPCSRARRQALQGPACSSIFASRCSLVPLECRTMMVTWRRMTGLATILSPLPASSPLTCGRCLRRRTALSSCASRTARTGGRSSHRRSAGSRRSRPPRARRRPRARRTCARRWRGRRPLASSAWRPARQRTRSSRSSWTSSPRKRTTCTLRHRWQPRTSPASLPRSRRRRRRHRTTLLSSGSA